MNTTNNKDHFDREDMLARFGNDAAMLEEIMESLVHEMQNCITEIENQISNNLESAQRNAHTIKGIALNMSFGILAQIALQLEQSIAKGKPDSAFLFKKLKDEWKLVLTMIR